MSRLTLIKLDIIHPPEYLQKKQKEWKDLSELSVDDYRNRLIALRSNYSDFYTYHLNQTGEWQAEEYFLMDDVFTDKIAKELFGWKYPLKKFLFGRGRFLVHYRRSIWESYVLRKFLQSRNDDVIFVRSQPIPSQFFRAFYRESLLVSRLSARLPKAWHPNDWDLIYTDQPDFKTFFELHGVRTILNDQGFDRRILDELETQGKKYDVTFVGGLGTENFQKRTVFLDALMETVNVQWWGYWWKYGKDRRKLADFTRLNKAYNGLTSGKEMFQIFKDSKIILNDYVDTANGIGFNQRMFEVMGCGAFMLTRHAPNFKGTFPEGIFATYENLEDLKHKIAYYLKNEDEREAIAKKGQRFVLENYDYERIGERFGKDLKKSITMKKRLFDSGH